MEKTEPESVMSNTENDINGKITCYLWHRGTVPDILASDPVDGWSQYAARVGDLLTTLATAGPYQPRTLEPDRLGEVPSTESAHLGKGLSRPVNGMYPILDLITEQGSSGLGSPCSVYQLVCLRSYSHLSRQDCHRSTISPRIHQLALTGCLFFHHESQLQNIGQRCSQALRSLWFERRDCEVSP